MKYQLYKYIAFIVLLRLIFSVVAFAQDNPSAWRGPDRRGIYNEEGLLNEWLDGGPELLWSFECLGKGHSSACIGNNRVYINGMLDTTGVLFSLDFDGNLLWKKEYGEEWHGSYPGTRSTPVIVGDLLYLESGMGVVFCFNAFTGNIVWSVNLLKKFNAENIVWGMTESLLIDNDRIICTPGGKKSNVVALDRFTGETLWTSPGYGEPPAYCSPVIIEHNGTRIVVTMTATSVIGLDAETGELYWRKEHQQANKIHANTPVYSNGIIYCSSGSSRENGGLLALELSDDGKSVNKLWRNEPYHNVMGGIIIIDNIIFGSKYRTNEWYAINRITGNENMLTDEFGAGVIIYADELFYCYSERGKVALIKMTPDSFEIKGSFRVPLGNYQHWAHPVIHNKRMYIRHGNALMVYNISSDM